MAEPKPLASLSAGLLARKGAARPAMRRQAQALDHNGLSGHEDLGWNDMGYDVNPHDHAAEIGRTAGHGLSPMSSTAQPSALEALDQAIDRVMPSHANAVHEGDYGDVQPFDQGQHIPEQAAPPAVHQQQQRIEQALGPVESPAAEAPLAEPQIAEAPIVRSIAAEPMAIEPEPVAAAALPVAPVAQWIAPVIAEQPASPSVPRRRLRAGTRGNFAFTLRLDPNRHLRLRLASATTNRSAQQIIIALVDDYLSNLPEIDAFAAQVPASKSDR